MLKEEKILQLAINRLNKILGEYNPPNIHWLSSQETDIDESEDRCYECAKKKAKKLTKKLKKEVIVNGGWGSQERDTCSHCQDCEKQLAYSLTEYGVESELDHFLSENIKLNILSKEGAYELYEVLDDYNAYDTQKERILKLAKKILQHNFWYRIKEPSKHQYCNTCGRNHHIWCCETFADISHLKKEAKLTDEECVFVNQLYICSWHKGSDKHFMNKLIKPEVSKCDLS